MVFVILLPEDIIHVVKLALMNENCILIIYLIKLFQLLGLQCQIDG